MAKISVSIPEDLLEKVRRKAREENRSLSNMIAVLLRKAVEG